MKISKKLNSTCKLIIVSFVISFLFFLTSCVTSGNLSKNEGDFEIQQVIEENYRIVSFPLDFTQIEMVCFPEKNDFKANGWFTGMYTRDFGRKSNCFVAINTSVFEVKNILQHMGFSRTIVGIYKTEGEVLCEPLDYFACLCFKDDKVWIARSQTEESVQNADFAFGGFFKILENGELIPWNDSFDVRMAVGLNADASRFYILTGKDLSFNQCALILKDRGCTEAMEFDGGSSTQIYIRNGYQTPMCVPPGSSLGFRFK